MIGAQRIWYIHGAHASPRSFAWLKRSLPHHASRDVSYTVDVPLSDNIDRFRRLLDEEDGEVSIVGHSLGGLIGGALANRSGKVRRLATLSTPWAGSRLADALRWFYPSQLYSDICTTSRVVTELRQTGVPVPTRSLVTVNGSHKLIREPNDGVVTVESQTALPGPEYIRLPLNHFEVLLAQESADYLKDFLFDDAQADHPHRPARQRQVHLGEQVPGHG